MKRNEILGELNTAKITAIKPGDTATVDTGQGITTTVDLKKNPTALMKDPTTGKLKLTATPTASNAPPEQGGQEKSEIKPGDEIEIAAQEASKAASIEQAPDGTYTVTYLRAPLSASGTPDDGKIPEPQTGIKDLATAQRIVASIDKEEDVASSMSSSIQVKDDTERLRNLAGIAPTAEQQLSPADQIKRDVAATAGMKPQEFAPGEIKPSQIFGHPQWLSTVQAMHKKYPTNKDQAMQAAKDAITQLIKQGK